MLRYVQQKLAPHNWGRYGQNMCQRLLHSVNAHTLRALPLDCSCAAIGHIHIRLGKFILKHSKVKAELLNAV